MIHILASWHALLVLAWFQGGYAEGDCPSRDLVKNLTHTQENDAIADSDILLQVSIDSRRKLNSSSHSRLDRSLARKGSRRRKSSCVDVGRRRRFIADAKGAGMESALFDPTFPDHVNSELDVSSCQHSKLTGHCGTNTCTEWNAFEQELEDWLALNHPCTCGWPCKDYGTGNKNCDWQVSVYIGNWGSDCLVNGFTDVWQPFCMRYETQSTVDAKYKMVVRKCYTTLVPPQGTYGWSGSLLQQCGNGAEYATSSLPPYQRLRTGCKEFIKASSSSGFSNGDIGSRVSGVASPDACKALCEQDADCGVIMYKSSTQQCQKKCAVGINCASSQNGATQAVGNGDATKEFWELSALQTSSHHGGVISANSVEMCQWRCEQDSQCAGVNIQDITDGVDGTDDFKCWMKKKCEGNVDSQVGNEKDISDGLARGFRKYVQTGQAPSPSGSYFVHTDHSILISGSGWPYIKDILLNTGDSSASCVSECDNDVNCAGFVYTRAKERVYVNGQQHKSWHCTFYDVSGAYSVISKTGTDAYFKKSFR